ncbi:restriction endonuclease [Ekhidna sp.]|jgi:restriction endonuclease Mrr|uniref:restriction endonuclease n=1 Tax=Ekhidna sp. TaxID=2608089 RepID=UPI0032ED742C
MRLNIFPESLLRLQEQVRPRGIDYTTSLLEKVQPLKTKIISQSAEMMIAQNEALKNNYVPLASLIGQSMFGIKDHTAFAVASKLHNAIDYLSAYDYEVDDYDEVDNDTLVEVLDNTKKIIREVYRDNNFLNDLHHRRFEEMIAELLRHRGFEVELTKQTRDGGYDILALNNVRGFPIKFLVECKRWSDNVGIDIIRSFCHVISDEKANKGIIVTSSYFSSEVIAKSEKEGHILDLENRDSVIDWVTDYELSKYR